MSEIVTTKFTGWDELRKKLQEELPKDAKLALRIALSAGAGDIKRAAQEFAPVEDEGPQAGFLRDNVKVKVKLSRNDLAGSAFIGPTTAKYPGDDKGTHKVTIRGKSFTGSSTPTAANVGRWLEFGTVNIAARGWLTKAWERTKAQALDHIIDKLKEKLKL